MTQTNWTEDVFGIRQWCLLILLWSCIKANASCPSGTFKSDFLSGGCALCPQKLAYCENEELEDAVRCFKACQPRYSTIQPIPNATARPPVQKSSTLLPITSTTGTPKIRKTIATQQVLDKLSSKKHHDRFMHGTPVFLTSSYSSDEQTSDKNETNIIILGVVLSFLALLLVIAVCFALRWWTGRGNATEVQQSKYTAYDAVPLGPRSNSDQSINDEISSSIDEAVVIVDIEPTSLSSSCEEFRNLPETLV